MTKVVLLLLATVALFLFSAGTFDAEGTAKGPGFGGCLSVSMGSRTVSVVAKRYRPNRSYFLVRVR